MKTWLECASSLSIGASFGGVGSGAHVDWKFFPVCFMFPFEVSMYGGIYLMISTVILGHVEKWKFLMAWRNVLRTDKKSSTLYHCVNYGLVIFDRVLSSASLRELGGLSGMLFRLTCHTHYVFYWWPSSIVRMLFTKLM